jgi:hypothetical protein
MKHAQRTEKYIRLIFNSYISDDDFFQKSMRIIDTNYFFLKIFKAKRGCALCTNAYYATLNTVCHDTYFFSK